MAPLQRGLRGCAEPTPGCRPRSPLRRWRRRRCSVHSEVHPGLLSPGLIPAFGTQSGPCLLAPVFQAVRSPARPSHLTPCWLRHPRCPSHTDPLYAPHTCPCPPRPLLGCHPPTPNTLTHISVRPGGRVLLEFHSPIKCHFPEGCHPPSHTTPRPRGAVQVAAASLRVPSSVLALLPHRTQAPGRGQRCPSCLQWLCTARPRDWQGA